MVVIVQVVEGNFEDKVHEGLHLVNVRVEVFDLHWGSTFAHLVGFEWFVFQCVCW